MMCPHPRGVTMTHLDLTVPTNWEPESNPGHFIIDPPDALGTIPALIGGES